MKPLFAVARPQPMRRRGDARRVVAALALAAALVMVPRAEAAVTIGSDLAPAPTGQPCSPLCTAANTTNPGQTIFSPIDGVVVRWRVRYVSGGASTRLKVIRPAAAGQFTGVNESDLESLPSTADDTLTFETRQPIKAGDLVGVSGQNAGPATAANGQPGVTLVRWQGVSAGGSGPLADGTTRAPDDTVAPPTLEVLVNADVEPDADCDGFGDETQDPLVVGGCLLPAAPPSPAQPSSEFGFGKVTRNRRKGVAFLVVNVPGPGNIGLRGPGLVRVPLFGSTARASRAVSGRGSVRLKVKARAKGRKARAIRRRLNRRGRARVQVQVTYVPSGGSANTRTRKLTLVKNRVS